MAPLNTWTYLFFIVVSSSPRGTTILSTRYHDNTYLDILVFDRGEFVAQRHHDLVDLAFVGVRLDVDGFLGAQLNVGDEQVGQHVLDRLEHRRYYVGGHLHTQSEHHSAISVAQNRRRK
jgi:hypothetical protein